MRILIDACLPTRCRTWFPGHTVEAGFEVLLTADRQMYRQHDFSKLPLAVVVTPGNRLSALNGLRDAIVATVERTAPGDTVEGVGLTAETPDGSETAP